MGKGGGPCREAQNRVAALPRECGFFVSGFTVFFGALDIGVVLGCRKSARHRADACWMLSSWGDSGCFCEGC